jgi:hypothetical protein
VVLAAAKDDPVGFVAGLASKGSMIQLILNRVNKRYFGLGVFFEKERRLLRAAAKLIGYRLGHYYRYLSRAILRRVSLHTA